MQWVTNVMGDGFNVSVTVVALVVEVGGVDFGVQRLSLIVQTRQMVRARQAR